MRGHSWVAPDMPMLRPVEERAAPRCSCLEDVAALLIDLYHHWPSTCSLGVDCISGHASEFGYCRQLSKVPPLIGIELREILVGTKRVTSRLV